MSYLKTYNVQKECSNEDNHCLKATMPLLHPDGNLKQVNHWALIVCMFNQLKWVSNPDWGHDSGAWVLNYSECLHLTILAPGVRCEPLPTHGQTPSIMQNWTTKSAHLYWQTRVRPESEQKEEVAMIWLSSSKGQIRKRRSWTNVIL